MKDMQKNHSFVIIACVLVFVVICASPIIAIRYQLWTASKYCQRVAALPKAELEVFAKRCDCLWTQMGARAAKEQYVAESNILSQFILDGEHPKCIYVNSHTVSVEYLRVGRLAARIQWEDYSQWGTPAWKLIARSGDVGYDNLYVKMCENGGQDKGDCSGIRTNATLGSPQR